MDFSLKKPKKSLNSHSSSNFDSTLIKRLKLVESELAAKNKVIAALQAEPCPSCPILKEKIAGLFNYIEQMHEFLKEKGYSIQGLPEETDESPDISKVDPVAVEAAKASLDQMLAQPQAKQKVDFSVLERRVEELNIVTSKDSSEYVKEGSSNMFKLRRKEETLLVIYKDALVLDKMHYKINSSGYKHIIQDILEGYIPSLLQAVYPNGVMIKIVNKLHLPYKESSTSSIDTVQVKKPMKSKEFLGKFPEKVIKNGRIVEVRKEMERFVNLKSEDHFLAENADFGGEGEKCNIQLNFKRADKILEVKIGKEAKISDFFLKIRDLTVQMKLGFPSKPLLYSYFPREEFRPSDEKTLGELGFYPSIALCFESEE